MFRLNIRFTRQIVPRPETTRRLPPIRELNSISTPNPDSVEYLHTFAYVEIHRVCACVRVDSLTLVRQLQLIMTRTH